MSAPRIKFKDEIEIGIASIDDKISASPKSSSKYMNHNLINTNDLPFVDSSLKSRRENLESRIKSHFRERNLNYTLSSHTQNDYSMQKKDVYLSDPECEMSVYDRPANYMHVSTIGEIQPSETLSNSSRRSLSRRESLKSNTSKTDNKISCTTVNRTFAIGAPWKPKFRPPERSIYYSNDGNKID